MRAIVVGAGILGASVAFHLARAGAAVTIVDAAHAGRATQAGAGIVCPWVSGIEDGAFYALYAAGARHYPSIIAELGDFGERDTGYSRLGALCVAEDPRALAAIEALARRRAAAAPEAGEVLPIRPEAAQAAL
ncbi:MAG: NAD(P)/FAD-dependent oxidoreductase, partial [Steroidobacteraceae bacterium]